MKVFYVNHFGFDEPTFGESDLKRVDKDYVNVDGNLMNAGFVWPATDENLSIYASFRGDMKAWKDLEPNMYATLNQMKRDPT